MLRKKKQQVGAAIRKGFYRLVLVSIGLAIVGCCILFLVNRKKYLHTVQERLAPQLVNVSYDHIYSQTVQQELQAFVRQQTSGELLLNFKPAVFSKQLKKQFPLISKVFVHRKSAEELAIFIVGSKPCLRLTDGRMLVNKPDFFKQELFADYELAKIPQLELSSTFTGQKMTQSLYSFFSKIPLAHWKKYYICYDAPEKIFVRPHEALLSYECVVDKDSFFDTKKLAQAEALFYQLSAPLQPTKKRKTRFIFDLRFADRIFVSQQTRGGGNEYRHAV